MKDNCLNEKIKVEQRTRNMFRYNIYVCVNGDCKEKCDRERLPTIEERQNFNG